MATFGEIFELCKVSNKSELIGIEKHFEEDHVILTFRNKEVLVYNVSDRKIVKSWSVEPKEKLTCPVVHSQESFYGIKDETWLLLWENDVPELWQSSMIMLQKPAQKIHVCMSRKFQHEPVLIFQDNDAIPFSRAGTERKRKNSRAEETMLWCGTHRCSDKEVWFSQALLSEDGAKVSLVMHLFKESKKHMYQVEAPEDSKILSWSLVDENDEEAFFISLWSNGGVYKTEIPRVSKAESGLKLNCELLFCVCENTISEGSLVQIFHVALSFVCVADGCKNTLSLWDTKFGTLHSRKSLSDCVEAATMSSCGILHSQSTSSYVIFANDTSVAVCSYTAEKSTLKSSLGVLKTSDKKAADIKPRFLTTPKLIEPGQSFEEWTHKVSKDDQDEDEMLLRLLDSKKTKTSKKLSAELRKYLEKVTDKKTHAEEPIVSQHFITSVFERCLQEKDLWSSETGALILEFHVLPQRCFSQYISAVLESNDLVLLQKCFIVLNGIPESKLVDCLKYVLRCEDDVFPICENTEIWEQIKVPCSLSRARYIMLILSHPINSAFLQTSLKELQFEETLLFMKFLLHIIEHWSTLLQKSLTMEGSRHPLLYTQILDWAGLTLNAHFTQLTILPEAQTLLVNLHRIVSDQITTCEHLDQLYGHVMQLKNRQPLPKTDGLGAYSIEFMDI